MILTTLWERYFLRQTARIFVFFLFGFYSLYVLIDYSNQSSSFKRYHFTFADILKFYGYEFILELDTLIPFAILIACIKTLCTLNRNNELIALMAGGVKLKRLLSPFVCFGILCTFIIYFNTEVLQPHALKSHQQFSNRRAKEKQKKHRYSAIQQLYLEDHSSLIFQVFDEVKESFYDVYWIRSIDEIYRIRYLYPYITPPKGSFVEYFQRNESGLLVLKESFDEKLFPEMHFNKETLIESVSSPDDQSISALKEKLPKKQKILNEKEARILTTYYYKLAFPWLCLIAVIGPAPFCIRFTRTLPIFFIYAFGIFGLVAFNIVLDASVILGERQVINPSLAIWIPFSCFLSFFLWRFIKL